MISWTRTAREHLKAIHDRIARDAPLTATRYVETLALSTLRLERHPLIGMEIREWPGYRRLLCKSHRIIYRVLSDQRIAIIAVYHQRQLLPPEPPNAPC